MDFEQKHFYTINEFLLKAVGQWPYDKRWKNYSCRFVIIFILTTGVIFQGSKLMTKWDIDLTINIIPSLTVSLAVLVCMISHYIHINKFNQIFEEIKNEWKDDMLEAEVNVKEEYAKNGRMVTIISSFYIFGVYVPAETGLVIRSIFVIYNETRRRHHPYEAEYFFIDDQKYFYPILLYIYLLILVISFVIVANESMYAVYVYHICGMFEVVGYRLKQIGRIKNRKKSDFSNFDNFTYNMIVRSIKTHQKAISIIAVMESYYGFSFLIELAAFTLMSAFTFVQAADWKSLHIRSTTFAIAQILYLGLVNFMGQKLINSSTKISEYAYSGQWYNCPIWIQRLIVPIIMRSQTPCILSACRFFVLSFENFRLILRAVISYCMVIRGLH